MPRSWAAALPAVYCRGFSCMYGHSGWNRSCPALSAQPATITVATVPGTAAENAFRCGERPCTRDATGYQNGANFSRGCQPPSAMVSSSRAISSHSYYVYILQIWTCTIALHRGFMTAGRICKDMAMAIKIAQRRGCGTIPTSMLTFEYICSTSNALVYSIAQSKLMRWCLRYRNDPHRSDAWCRCRSQDRRCRGLRRRPRLCEGLWWR